MNPDTLKNLCLKFIDRHGFEILESLTSGVYSRNHSRNPELIRPVFTADSVRREMRLNSNHVKDREELNVLVFKLLEEIRREFVLTGNETVTIKVCPKTAKPLLESLAQAGFSVVWSSQTYNHGCYDDDYWVTIVTIVVSFRKARTVTRPTGDC